MASYKDCVHVEVCREYVEGLAAARGVRLSVKELDSVLECDDCKHFKDRSRFVELPTAHWIRNTPDRNIMREFHKQGIGRGMSENSIFWTCSNCGSWGNLSFKYCPFCSAKIEEAEQALKLKERENDAE